MNYRRGKWCDDLLEIKQRYLVWLRTHPGREYAPRAPAIVVNPMGEKLGLEDDGAASDEDEDYSSDGGFVVADDQKLSTDENSYREEALSEPEAPDGERNGDETNQDSSERIGSDSVDSDSSVPSLADAPKATTPINSPRTEPKLRRKSKTSHLGQRPSARDHGNSESNIDSVPKVDRRKRKRLIVISSSDDEDKD